MEENESLKNRVKEVFSKLDYKNIDITLESGSKRGDGFMGQMIRAIISGEKNGTKEEVDMIVKCAPNEHKIRKYMGTTPLFNREIFYYTEIVPVYEKLQETKNISIEMKYIFPKCIATKSEFCEEFIMLENLKSIGYTMCSKNVLDYEHSEIAFRTLGKLHALSYILEEENKTMFVDLCRQLGDTYFTSQNDYDSSGMYGYGKKAMIKCMSCIEDKDIKKILNDTLGDNPVDKLKKLYESGNKKVISHGDYWINNMLFKYEDGKPTKVIPFDFQNCRYMSSANDFFHLFPFSSSTDVRRKYFWKLIRVYYKSLSDYLAACGFEVEKFCTFQELEEEIYQQAIFGLVVTIAALPFRTSEQPWELHEVYAGNDPTDMYVINEEYKTHLYDMVTDYINFGFLK
ncbi:hypothetical protein EVAR_28046_1 [Eumeta japonica]|uniref:CHK kinase-like domain-containing protein n=1 Tax=Eumeta variegata TaxID=151549 RepID=A0A4C1W8L2_EUMVA|nr:hypothetical protein EVAR_28046_1 [Eumeta japonica]